MVHNRGSVLNNLYYRIAGNIGGEFNLAVWRMSGRSAKLNSAKYSADRDADLIPIPVYSVDVAVVLGVRLDSCNVLMRMRARVHRYEAAVPGPAHAEITAPRSAKLKTANLQKFGKMRNPPNIIPANISGYTVHLYVLQCFWVCATVGCKQHRRQRTLLPQTRRVATDIYKAIMTITATLGIENGE